MGASPVQAVAVLVSRLQRAAKRMAKRSPSSAAKKPFSTPPSPTKARKDVEVGLWRKEILMGERCQLLDFSGVIYYDAEGRRLAHPPRSPMHSLIPASPKLAAGAGRLGLGERPSKLLVA